VGQTDLSRKATEILTLLYKTPSQDLNMDNVSRYIAPQATFQHDEDAAVVASREQVVKMLRRQSEKKKQVEVQVKEACVDEQQRKVWVLSEVTVGKVRKESVDMMQFDEDGLLVGCADWERVVKRRQRDDD